jgi:hypothetical protein
LNSLKFKVYSFTVSGSLCEEHYSLRLFFKHEDHILNTNYLYGRFSRKGLRRTKLILKSTQLKAQINTN